MWEYRVVHGTAGRKSERLTDELNKLGAEGWEAVGVTSEQASLMVVLLKRPVS